MKTKGLNLDEFQEQLERTLRILKAREYGLLSWHNLLAQNVESLKAMLAESEELSA